MYSDRTITGESERLNQNKADLLMMRPEGTASKKAMGADITAPSSLSCVLRAASMPAKAKLKARPRVKMLLSTERMSRPRRNVPGSIGGRDGGTGGGGLFDQGDNDWAVGPTGVAAFHVGSVIFEESITAAMAEEAGRIKGSAAEGDVSQTVESHCLVAGVWLISANQVWLAAWTPPCCHLGTSAPQ